MPAAYAQRRREEEERAFLKKGAPKTFVNFPSGERGNIPCKN
jgi:hypothetical protein